MSGDDPFEEFKKAVDGARGAFQHAGHILTAQAAMGWVMQGDLKSARRVLLGLPPEKLQEASVAAAALSSLVDELLAGGGPGMSAG